MSKTFRYAICNNKVTQILHGSKAVWYDDDGNRHVEEVKYIEADNWEQAKELIKQRGSEVAVAENATTTQAQPKPLNMAKARAALVEIIEYLEPIRKWTMPSKENHTRLTALFAAVDTVYTKAKAALAEPVKNCEMGTIKEQSQRFNAFCDAHKYVGDDGANWCSMTCPCYNDIDCGVKWAQMPYESEAAK